MSIGLRESRRRNRRNLQWTLLKVLLALALIGGAGVYAYYTGKRLAELETGRLQDEIQSLTARIGQMQSQIDASYGVAQAAKTESEDWRRRYERDVPRGPAKEVFDAVQTRLAAGVEPDRLKAVLAATQNRRDCRTEAEAKRHPVALRQQRGPRPTVTFGRGAIMVSAEGVGAQDESGKPENWFDASQPVTIRMVRPGGIVHEVSGMLPLSPTVITGEREYRFTVVSKTRGFVNIAAESCRFP